MPSISYSCVELILGWLTPLADRLADDWSVLAMPIIDVIDYINFAYRTIDNDIISAGGFNWDLIFIWLFPSPEEQQRRTNKTAPIM